MNVRCQCEFAVPCQVVLVRSFYSATGSLRSVGLMKVEAVPQSVRFNVQKCFYVCMKAGPSLNLQLNELYVILYSPITE